MTFEIIIDPHAQSEIDEFAAYANTFSIDYAAVQKERLDRFLFVDLARNPLRWGYFPLTGAPYHGYLFTAGRKAKYWLIYSVDERSLTVRILILAFKSAPKDSSIPGVIQL